MLGTTSGLVYFWMSVQSEQNMSVSWMNPEAYQFMMAASQTFNQNFSITGSPHYFILFHSASQKSYMYLTCLSSAFFFLQPSHKNRSSLGIKNLVCVCVCDYRPISKNSTRYIQNSNCTTGVEWVNGHILIFTLSLEGWISLLGHRVIRRVKSISSSPIGNHSFSGRSPAGLALTLYKKQGK